MTDGPVIVARNRAGLAEIVEHLHACSDSFVPPLNARVDVDAYAGKILACAERFEAWSGDGLCGLLAAYCNEPQQRVAFITNVSVLPSRQGQGLGTRILRAYLVHIRERGFERIDLQVDPRNEAAIHLYQKHGFRLESTGESSQVLRLQW